MDYSLTPNKEEVSVDQEEMKGVRRRSIGKKLINFTKRRMSLDLKLCTDIESQNESPPQSPDQVNSGCWSVTPSSSKPSKRNLFNRFKSRNRNSEEKAHGDESILNISSITTVGSDLHVSESKNPLLSFSSKSDISSQNSRSSEFPCRTEKDVEQFKQENLARYLEQHNARHVKKIRKMLQTRKSNSTLQTVLENRELKSKGGLNSHNKRREQQEDIIDEIARRPKRSSVGANLPKLELGECL